jgi:hypothetical protein
MKKILLTLTLTLLLLPSVALAIPFGGSGITSGPNTILQNGGGLDSISGVEFISSAIYFESGPLIQAPVSIPDQGCGGPLKPCVPFDPFEYRWAGGGSFVIESGFRWDPSTHPTPALAGAVTGASFVVTAYNSGYSSFEGEFVLDLVLDADYAAATGWSAGTLTFPIHPRGFITGIGYTGIGIAVPERFILTPTPVLEPSTWLLLGTGLAGAGIFGRKRVARQRR